MRVKRDREKPGRIPFTIINAETGHPFTYKDPCVQIDPHTGYNEAAENATSKAVKDFVRTVFKLER